MEGTSNAPFPQEYLTACGLAEGGQIEQARAIYESVESADSTGRLKALVTNDLGVLLGLEGRLEEACNQFQSALAIDAGCEPARLNLAVVECSLEVTKRGAVLEDRPRTPPTHGTSRPIRVAILSFLFNWPSTGGGIIHTVELAQFLSRAGFEVRHFHARHESWGVGSVENPPFPTQAIEFDDSRWNGPDIQARFRRAVDEFDPDYVLITDTWNMKPLLAEAVRGYPYFLRFQALECLCPLNNLRLLPLGPERVEQCPRHQLATPEVCHRCLAERGQHSGLLHQRERALAGVGTPAYDSQLRRALEEAEAVLVLNPFTGEMMRPYAPRVRVVTWGMDPARFPWPVSEKPANGKTSIFMAAVVDESIKGFHVIHQACHSLWQSRRDFELVVTGDPPGQVDDFTRFVGWATQDQLPAHYRASDICVVPTIAQEGLSRTSVEAMASGLPVVASRIGGLPHTVTDGVTGLLFEPGDADDLARTLALLLDDPALGRKMGQAGRRRFEADFTWDVVIERDYRSLLKPGIKRPRDVVAGRW